MKLYIAAISAALMLVLSACGPQYIQGTEIEDNPTNRSIVMVVEAYRQAVEKKDVDTLAALLSSKYFENASTTGNADDDYGYKEVLTRLLPLLQQNIKEVFYNIEVKSIDMMGESANVHLEYEIKFHYVEGEVDGWSLKKDRSRLDLVWEDEAWKIVGGL